VACDQLRQWSHVKDLFFVETQELHFLQKVPSSETFCDNLIVCGVFCDLFFISDSSGPKTSKPYPKSEIFFQTGIYLIKFNSEFPLRLASSPRRERAEERESSAAA
jgi:hypothetical protein